MDLLLLQIVRLTSDVIVDISYFGTVLIVLNLSFPDPVDRVKKRSRDFILLFSGFLACQGILHLFQFLHSYSTVPSFVFLLGAMSAIFSVIIVSELWKLTSQIRLSAQDKEAALVEPRSSIVELSDSDEALRYFQETNPTCSSIKQDGVLVYANKCVRDIYGGTVGKSDEETFPIEVANAIKLNDNFVLESGEPTSDIEIVPDLQGNLRHWRAFKFRLALQSGVCLGEVRVDITESESILQQVQVEKGELQEEVLGLQREKSHLIELDRIRDNFIETASHEIRSPIANIKLATEMLNVFSDPSQQKTYIDILNTECNRETELVNDLLDLQKMKHSQIDPVFTLIDLGDWIDEIVLPYVERSKTLGQQIEIRSPKDLSIQTDGGKLGRILTELLTNACKYTPSGGTIFVEVNLLSDLSICLSIHNTGEIPAESLPRIFEKFYRIPQLDFRFKGGTGLGLNLASELSSRIGGHLGVESKDNWTTFRLTLPSSPVLIATSGS